MVLCGKYICVCHDDISGATTLPSTTNFSKWKLFLWRDKFFDAMTTFIRAFDRQQNLSRDKKICHMTKRVVVWQKGCYHYHIQK